MFWKKKKRPKVIRWSFQGNKHLDVAGTVTLHVVEIKPFKETFFGIPNKPEMINSFVPMAVEIHGKDENANEIVFLMCEIDLEDQGFNPMPSDVLELELDDRGRCFNFKLLERHKA